MANPSNHIAAAAASIALVGAFGAGAFALSQGEEGFDPENFIQQYAQGNNDPQKGYQANQTDTDADANRHGDEDQQKSDAESSQDVNNNQSNLPSAAESGTTALRVSDKAADGSVVTPGNGNGDTNAGDGGENPTGPVIPADVVPGNGDNNTDNNGDNDNTNNGGGDNSKPDNGNDNNGSSTGGYDVLPQDPTPDKDSTNSSNQKVSPVNRDGITDDYDSSDINVTIYAKENSPYEYQIYQGQKLDAWSLFCVIDARFTLGHGWDAPMYEWICDSKEEFESYPYFKITDFPETAPNKPFDIKVAYRFDSNGEWQEKTLTITPQESCVFIVSTALDESGSPAVIAQGKYQNKLNLFEYTEKALQSLGAINDYGESTQLILNWKENGEVVDSMYSPTTPGRHVVQIGDTIPAPEGCHISIDYKYLDALYALQNLTSVDNDSPFYTFNDEGQVTLSVPDGIQSIYPSAGFYTWLYAEEIVIPSSVKYIEATDEQLTVTSRYTVSEDNSWYSSTDSGILTNKEGTQYLGIPQQLAELSVPETITTINFTWNNVIESMTLEAKDADGLPHINWGGKSNLNVIVDDSLLKTFIMSNLEDLGQDSGNTVSPKSSPEEKYYRQDYLIRSDNDLIGITDDSGSSVTLDSPLAWKSGAFSNSDITDITISRDYELNLEDGCLANSNVARIRCATQTQKEYLEQRLAAAGASDVDVSLLDISKEGYTYLVDGDETTILSAPRDATEFTGVITAESGEKIKATSLAPDLFVNSEALTWVNLDTSVTTIGARAFNSCPNLQGLFIANKESISVGSDAYTNCRSLRFVASNAMNASYEKDTMSLNQGCRQWCLEGSSGYPGNWYNYFEYFPSSIVNEYSLRKACEGNYVLYGCMDDRPWLIVGSGASIAEGSRLTLEKSTAEIYGDYNGGAFKDIASAFTVNWEDLNNLQFIDEGAFSSSGLQGDVVVCSSEPNAEIGNYAFSYSNISSFTSTADYLAVGDYAFSYSKNLKSISIGAGKTNNEYGSYLPANCFNGCNALSAITFTNANPIELNLASENTRTPFAFNNELPFKDEAAKIHLEIPKEYQQTYIQEWAIKFYGFSDYNSLHSNAYEKAYEKLNSKPTEEQVAAEMKLELLEGENHLRSMMGLEQVSETTVVIPDVDDSDLDSENQDDSGSIDDSDDELTELPDWPDLDGEEINDVDNSSDDSSDNSDDAEDAVKPDDDIDADASGDNDESARNEAGEISEQTASRE